MIRHAPEMYMRTVREQIARANKQDEKKKEAKDDDDG